MTTRHDDDGITRREFGTRLGAAAGIAIGSELFGARVNAAPHVGGRILGANDRVVTASIGIRGQGNALKRGFARLPNVEIKTLCDIDANLAPERINDTRLADVTTFKPGFARAARLESMTHLRRLTTLAELANAAAFLVSDQASAMTGTVANLSGGAIVE